MRINRVGTVILSGNKCMLHFSRLIDRIDTAPYHDSPLRAVSTGNRKEYHLELDVPDEDGLALHKPNSRHQRKDSERKLDTATWILSFALFVAPSLLRPILPSLRAHHIPSAISLVDLGEHS